MLFVGAVGKSAQLPLYFWLPDAMEGPTPVSALIHAATMVTAGVFLMVRMNPMLGAAADWVPTLIAVVGAATALFAATVAVAQNDIKKVLAYSTVSQLGYMFLAVGSGAYVAAIFHMVTHAFFKALLFLGSGSVIHGMHDEQDMRRMGLLRKFMPITAATFIVGWLAIAGVPPFAGFWSKDEILLFALDKSPILYVVGLVTALLTAYYMTRQVIMVFFGEAKWQDASAEHGAHGDFKPHESPPVMFLPLVALAGLSIVGGIIQLPAVTWIANPIRHKLEDWLHPMIPDEAEIAGSWGSDDKTLLMADRRPSSRWPASPARSTCTSSSGPRPSSRRSSSRPGTTTRRSAGSWAGPAARRSRPRPGSTPTSSTVRSTARARSIRGLGRHRPQGAERIRAHVRRHHRPRRRRPAGLVRHLPRGPVMRRRDSYPRSDAEMHPDAWGNVRDGGLLMDGATSSFPILTMLILLPVAGAVAVAISSSRRPDLVKLIALISMTATAAMSIWLLASFESGEAGFQFVSKHSWIERWGISWHLGVDGISLLLVVLTGILFPLAILATDPHHDEKPYLAWLLLLQAGVMGSFLSLDLFVFFIFFEIVLVPMYFLIGGWGYGDRVYAATKFFLYTMFGSAFMLVGIIATVVLAKDHGVGHITFDLPGDRPERLVPGDHRALAVLLVRHRVPRQGAGVPVAHLAARRPHAGADRRLGDPGRRDAEARHLRPAPVRRVPVPRGGALGPTAAAHARRHRRSSTAPSSPRCRRTSSGSSPTRRSPTSASSCSARSRSRTRRSPAACCR